jgi:hypothetical protein
VDLDVRWGHDFHLTPSKEEESPKLGFSAGAFNVLNHENATAVDQVESSSSFGQVTSGRAATADSVGDAVRVLRRRAADSAE